jgi:hypothetical protein
MKKCFLIFLLVSLRLQAQTPYQVLDSLSRKIRLLQAGAANRQFQEYGVTYTISYPDENFGVLSYNRLAYSAIFKTSAGQEVQEITEEIDLVKATDLEILREKDVVAVRVDFSESQLNTLVLNNGLAQKKNTNSLYFFSAADNTSHETSALYSSLIELISLMKEEKDAAQRKKSQQLAEQWQQLATVAYPQNLVAYEKLLRENPASLYRTEARKRIASLTVRRQKEEQRQREAKQARERVYQLASLGDQSYRSYHFYYQADSLASQVLRSYSAAELGAGKTDELRQFRQDLQTRYRWNKEYFQKRDQLLFYDNQAQQTEFLTQEYTHKLEATVNPTIYLKASLLTLGGLATLVGGYATLAKDNAFEPKLRQDLLLYGGSALGIGLTWTIIQGSSVKRAGRRANDSRRKTAELRASLGEIVEKRNQLLRGQPLINPN